MCLKCPDISKCVCHKLAMWKKLRDFFCKLCPRPRATYLPPAKKLTDEAWRDEPTDPGTPASKRLSGSRR